MEGSSGSRRFTRFRVVLDSVLEPVLPGIEFRVLALFFILELLQELLLLLLCELLAVNAFVLFLDLCNLLLVVLALFSSHDAGCLLGKIRCHWLHVIFRRRKLDIDICLDAANLIVRLGVNHINQVLPASILNADGSILVQDRVVREFLLQAAIKIIIVKQNKRD